MEVCIESEERKQEATSSAEAPTDLGNATHFGQSTQRPQSQRTRAPDPFQHSLPEHSARPARPRSVLSSDPPHATVRASMSAAARRITKEYAELQADCPPNVVAAPDESNLLHWVRTRILRASSGGTPLLLAPARALRLQDSR